MAKVALKLAEITFSEYEIPEHIRVSTTHRHVVHKLVGGKRAVDMLGADHMPISWSGWLVGSTALDRASAIKGYHDEGDALQLSWSNWQYKVVITEFEVDYQRDYQIPYSITCTVVQDYNNIHDREGAPSVDSDVRADMTSATSLASSIGDSGIMSAVSSVKSAISNVSNFATAVKSQINSVLTPIAQARAQVQTLIASTENTLKNVTTLGGILPNNPLARNVANLSTQVNAMTNQAGLVQLDSVLGRMGVNIGQLNTGVKSIQATSGSLFDLASKHFGSVSGWSAISAANPQLGADTEITEPTTVVIPPAQNVAPPAATPVAPNDPPAEAIAPNISKPADVVDGYDWAQMAPENTGGGYYTKGISF
jgi:hypothetical protein